MYVFYECLISSMKLEPGKGYIVVTASISDLAGVLWDTEMFVNYTKSLNIDMCSLTHMSNI